MVFPRDARLGLAGAVCGLFFNLGNPVPSGGRPLFRELLLYNTPVMIKKEERHGH